MKSWHTVLFLLWFVPFSFTNPVFSNDTPSQVVSETAQQYAMQVKEDARNDPAQALNVAAKALEYFQQNPSPVEEVVVLNESSYALYFQARYPEALARAKDAEAKAKSFANAKGLARAWQLQGNVMQTIGEFESALKLYERSLKFYTDTNDTEWLGRILYNMGNVYLSAGRHSEALDYYQRYGRNAHTDMERAELALALANVYANTELYEKAKQEYEKSLVLFQKAGDEVGIQLSHSGLAYIYFAQEKYREALSLYDQAYEVMKSGARQYNEANILKHKAETLIQLREYDKAIEVIQDALKIVARQQVSSGSDFYDLLAEIYVAKEDVKSALAAINKSREMKRERSIEEASVRVAVMKVAFDAQLREQEVELLKNKTKIQELELKQQNAIWVIAISLLLVLTGAMFFWLNHRSSLRLLNEQRAVSEKLRELDKTKDQVLANTSHELRTPLNGIIGMTQLILSEPEKLSEELREQISVVEQCGERLLHLVQDILDYSQLQSGRLRINQSVCELKPVMLSAHNLLKPLADEKGLGILLYIPSELPKVMIDSHRIEQVLLNLLGNAIKFSRRGTITFAASRHNDYFVEVSVKDEGPGIDASKLQTIFQPFEQADGAFTRQEQGSGLGLPITRELLKLHGSDLSVQSVYGQGAEFSFLLPIALNGINL